MPSLGSAALQSCKIFETAFAQVRQAFLEESMD